MEQRKYSRRDVQQSASIKINDKNISCNVQNLSSAGAYIKVDDRFANDVLNIEIGADVDLVFDSGKQSIRGKVLRYMCEKNALFIAVYFMQNYYFE